MIEIATFKSSMVRVSSPASFISGLVVKLGLTMAVERDLPSAVLLVR